MDHMHSTQTGVANPCCIDCGILFSSPLDVYKHTIRGCNEEPPTNKFKADDSDESEDDSGSDSDESEDDSGWDNLINEAYEEYDDVYDVKVQQYEQEGCSNEEARDKASEDLFFKYQKYVMQMYKNVLYTTFKANNE